MMGLICGDWKRIGLLICYDRLLPHLIYVIYVIHLFPMLEFRNVAMSNVVWDPPIVRGTYVKEFI